MEKPLADYAPTVEVPDAQVLRRAIDLPSIPWEMPAVRPLLEQFIGAKLDPWSLDLPDDSDSAAPRRP